MIDRINIEPARDPEGNMHFNFEPHGAVVWLTVTKAEAMAFFDLVERKPPGYGMTATVLFTELCQAQEKDCRADAIGTVFRPLGGPAVAEWVRDVARNFLSMARSPTPEDTTVVDPAQAELPIDGPRECDYVKSFGVHHFDSWLGAPATCTSCGVEREPPQVRTIPAGLSAGYGPDALPGTERRFFVMPEVEKNINLIGNDTIDQDIASPEGRLWMAYTARINQYESAYGVASTTLCARIDCMRRALAVEGIK